MSKLNSKTLTIAAVVLMVLALLFMATPLLRVSGVTNRAGFNRQFNGQANPGGQNGFPFPGNGTQVPGNPTFPTDPNNPTTRQFPNRTQGLIGFGLLSGITGTIVYGIALLVSLAAAVGMFLTKRWGQILGILMGVVYVLLAVVSFLPQILTAFTRGLNPLSLGLNILHLILAVAVIVLALIPAKKILASAAPAAPVTPATPPAASA